MLRLRLVPKMMIWGGVEERKPDHLIPASAKNILSSDQEDRKYKFKIIEIRMFCDNDDV